MPFQIFDKQEDIPEAQRDVYEERDGKWHAKVPDVANLNSALEKERLRAEKEERDRKKFEKDLADLRRKEAAREGNVSEETLNRLRKEDEDRRKPIEEENTKLKFELTKVKKTDRVQSLALKSGIMQDRIEDAMLLLEKRTGLTDDGDTITVLDKDGKVTTTPIEQFLKTDFKKEKPWLYAGSGASGSGASGSTGGGGDAPPPAAAVQEKSLAAKRAMVAGAF